METNTTPTPAPLAFNQPVAITWGVDGSGIALRWLGHVAAIDGPDVLVRPDAGIPSDSRCFRDYPLAGTDGPLRVVPRRDVCDRSARRDAEGRDGLWR